MWLRKTANFLEKLLSPVGSIIGHIGSGVVALAMLLIVADISGRRFFNQPITGTYEITQFMLVIIVFCTIAYCQFLKGHVRIELFVSRLQQKTREVINVICYIFFLATFSILTWQLYLYAVEMLVKDRVSGTLVIPVYPFAFIAFLGCAVLCLMVLMGLFVSLARVIEK